MTTLAVDTYRNSELGSINEFPVVASDIIYEGAAGGLVDASGHVRPLTTADQFVGFCESQADNSAGAAAAINARFKRAGAAQLAVSGAVITDVGQPVYASDDNAFSFNPAVGVFIGFVRRYVSSGVVVVEYDVDNFVDPWEGRVRETLAAATKTLDAEDIGKVICCTVDTVITLPATATALDNVTLLCVGPFGTVEISADPAADDKIMGPDIAGTNNKDLVNTKATARRGDFITLKSGHTDGYTATDMAGTWATES